MEIYRIYISWLDAAGEFHEDIFATRGPRVFAEVNKVLTEQVAPSAGDSCDVSITRAGTFRDTAA